MTPLTDVNLNPSLIGTLEFSIAHTALLPTALLQTLLILEAEDYLTP